MNRTSVWVTKQQYLITELQTHGLRLVDPGEGAPSRRGGAGPSDHKAVNVMGTTVMVPIHTNPAARSPYLAKKTRTDGMSILECDGEEVGVISFPRQPGFYSYTTSDGVPAWKIAQLHSSDVLATTVLQTCIRYGNRETACQFCAIGESLRQGRTVARKTPQQLAEVAAEAVRLDGVRHAVLTTGTPATPDRGAAVLCESAAAIKSAVGIPIQGQCEPPADFTWFATLRAAGVDSLGMHLEAFDPKVRARIMPGKATVSVEFYFEAFNEAVKVFSRGQVSTYILAGLGDSIDDLIEGSARLIAIGVYPFIVPFVPITGTPLQNHPAPSSEFMRAVLQPVGAMLREAGLVSSEIKAGCGKCGACSALSTFEK
jgi:radical SAM protein (TIGR04043 family)